MWTGGSVLQILDPLFYLSIFYFYACGMALGLMGLARPRTQEIRKNNIKERKKERG